MIVLVSSLYDTTRFLQCLKVHTMLNIFQIFVDLDTVNNTCVHIHHYRNFLYVEGTKLPPFFSSFYFLSVVAICSLSSDTSVDLVLY